MNDVPALARGTHRPDASEHNVTVGGKGREGKAARGGDSLSAQPGLQGSIREDFPEKDEKMGKGSRKRHGDVASKHTEESVWAQHGRACQRPESGRERRQEQEVGRWRCAPWGVQIIL